MRIIQTIIFPLLASLILTSCDYLSNSAKPIAQDTTVTNNVCKPYFAFDRIEYYRINVSSDTLSAIAKKKNRTPQDTLFENILSYGYLNSLKDSLILNTIEKLGYKKLIMPHSTHQVMSEIFCERKHENWEAYGCIPVYRDIFVFRQQERITGIAKICFSCRQSSITGTNCNTEYFGQSGDFEKLESVLRPLLGL